MTDNDKDYWLFFKAEYLKFFGTPTINFLDMKIIIGITAWDEYNFIDCQYLVLDFYDNPPQIIKNTNFNNTLQK